MLGECTTHGYYKGDICPVCKTSGKFLMNDRELESINRFISGLLRHFPAKFGLGMDEHGWVRLSDLEDTIRKHGRRSWLNEEHLRAIVAVDEKGRYQIDENNGTIRATYAHTVDIDLSDLPDADIDTLYYPVSEEELDIVLEHGISPMDRKFVHLSATLEQAKTAGKVRTPNPIILSINARGAVESGCMIKKASNVIYISDYVGKDFITKDEE